MHCKKTVHSCQVTNTQKQHNEHIQQVTEQKATFLSLVKEQQKKIEELMKQSKNLIDAMTKEKPIPETSVSTMKTARESKKMVVQTLQRNACAVDTTMLTALSAIAGEQAHPTEKNATQNKPIFGLCSNK